MCDLCIGGLHIPYSALLPILAIALQWMVAQLSKAGIELPEFISKRLPAGRGGGVNTNSSSAGKKKSQQQQLDNVNVCKDIFCFCKSAWRKSRGRTSNESESSVASTADVSDEGSFESDGEEEEETVEHVIEKIHRRRRGKRSQTNNHAEFQLIPGEWCMPCSEIQTS